MDLIERNPGCLVITGMDAAWGGCDGPESAGAAAYERMVYQGQQRFAAPGSSPRREQAAEWLAESARRALNDAGVLNLAAAGAAVLYASDQPLNLRLPWAAVALDLSRESNFVPAALERAHALLADHPLVVIAAAGVGEVNWAAVPLAENGALGFDRATHGWRFGWGAGAVVLTTGGRARAEGRRVYAIVRGLAASGTGTEAPAHELPVPPTLEDVRSCCRQALEQAGCRAEEIGYVEAFASGLDALDGVEIAGLCQVYRAPSAERSTAAFTTALGSGQSNHGYLFAAAGLASLVRAAVCVYHRILPASPGWSAPKLPALWRGSAFWVPTESRTWFARRDGPGRLAAVNFIGRRGSFAHLILSEDLAQTQRPNRAIASGGFLLFPLAGDSVEDLLEQLEDLKGSLAYAANLSAAAQEAYETSLERSARPNGAQLAVAILGHTHEEILREIDLALKSIPAAYQKGSDWQTPLGSCFSADPAGRQGTVALVYGGAFNSYPGVGKDLFHLFPSLFSFSFEGINDLGHIIREHELYPRSLTALTKEEQAAAEAHLLANPVAMLISGSALAVVFTAVLEEVFKVQVGAAFGYSLGENSMMYALRVWQEGDEASARLEKSPLFLHRLAGPQNAVREFWGLPPAERAGAEPLWNNYLVMAPPDAVQAALAGEKNVYLTHINTPRQVVIGGDPEGCKRVIAALRCSSLQAPFDYALHCDPIRSEQAGLMELHHWPVQHVPRAVLYSAAGYEPLRVEPTAASSRDLAERIADMLCSPLDFPRLVNRVYADGARVFIEAGAGSNCARWIDEILKGRPHLALAVNRRGSDDYSTLVRLLARLHSHCVPLDLSPLYALSHAAVSRLQ